MRRWPFLHLSSAVVALQVLDAAPVMMTLVFLANAFLGIRDLLKDEDALW